MLRVHLDTDIGGDIDDLCALALLLTAPTVTITGITTVLEEQGQRAGDARYVLAPAGRTAIPVAAGADLSLGRWRLPAGLPAADRYWPQPVPPAPGPLTAALDLLAQSIAQGAVVVGIGPWTNLALLEQRFPGLLGQTRLYLMGGTIHSPPPGFPDDRALVDYNLQADPEAAAIVLQSATPTLVPLEVTVQTALRRAHLPALRRSGPLGRLIARQARAFAADERPAERDRRTWAGLPPDFINFQHDPLTVAVALGWPGVAITICPLAFDHPTGRLVATDRGRPTPVVTAVDGEAFSRYWLGTVTARREAPGDRRPGGAVARDPGL